MSEAAKQLFAGLKAVKEGVLKVAPGLENIVPDLKAEMSRLGTQGTMELASALFNGNGFVPYGPGQYTPDVPQEHGSPDQAAAEQGMERESLDRGMER
jgi:hypothetical protein